MPTITSVFFRTAKPRRSLCFFVRDKLRGETEFFLKFDV
jgi:hypothetical protein